MWYAVINTAAGNTLSHLTESPDYFTPAPLAIVPLNRNDRPDAMNEQWDAQTLTFVAVQRRIVSKLEFLRLFTQAERMAIKRASKVSEQLEDFLYLLELAQEVNLDSVDTQAGVMMLEQAGILAAGRAAEILAG